jgi:cytoskeletal protein CcmA (bactofilin family)
MLKPLTTLQEAGFAPSRGAADRLSGWTPEFISGLDWLRLAELARALAAESGCELAGSRSTRDGSVMFGMLEQPRSSNPQRALVKITSWNEWGATPATIERFAQELSTTSRETRGVLIAPAGFSTAALHAAQQHRIEAVDATALHAALQSLPKDRRDFFFLMAAQGEPSVPTCPCCQRPLRRITLEEPSLPSRTIDVSGLIADEVVCDDLIIAPGCDATFLHEVRARSITVRGRVEGDFYCQGKVRLEDGGTLSGSVAARSLEVQDGGALLGQFRILEGNLEPLVKREARWQWRCHQGSSSACAEVQFEPHEASAS